MHIVTSEEMRRIDRYAIDHIGMPAMVLMENAGRAVSEEVISFLEGRPGRIAILTGKGNNGGDGIVAGRHLSEAGYQVHLIYAESPDRFQGEAALQSQIAHKWGLPHYIYSEQERINWELYDAVVDALLGTGSRGAPRGVYAKLIEEVNRSGRPVISIDIPSGLDADTGQIHTPCIRADRTVALAFTKRGLEQYPGVRQAGTVIVRSIGIPQGIADRMNVNTYLIQEPLLSAKLALNEYRHRQSDTHKGTFGHVLVAAGSRAMAGAGLLSAKAALRSGAGLVSWALPMSMVEPLLGHLPEVMLQGVADEQHGDWRAADPKELIAMAQKKNAMLFGPGTGRFAQDDRFVRRIWEETACPLVIDADGLNMIAAAADFDSWSRRKSPVVLTPHPGEMARLCGRSVPEVQQDRITCARNYAVQYHVTLVLKGARTVVATPDGTVYVNPTGNAGMATGGSGDVLAGLISGLLAQGYTAAQASALGVYLHGAAGDRAVQRRCHSASLIAGDIVENL